MARMIVSNVPDALARWFAEEALRRNGGRLGGGKRGKGSSGRSGLVVEAMREYKLVRGHRIDDESTGSGAGRKRAEVEYLRPQPPMISGKLTKEQAAVAMSPEFPIMMMSLAEALEQSVVLASESGTREEMAERFREARKPIRAAIKAGAEKAKRRKNGGAKK